MRVETFFKATGFDALADSRTGKRTLRTHGVTFKPVAEVLVRELIRLREKLDLSLALFAEPMTHGFPTTILATNGTSLR